MTKFFSSAALIGLALSAAVSASAAGLDVQGFDGFVSRISCPAPIETVTATPAFKTPEVAVPTTKQNAAPAVFTRLCAGDMDVFYAYRAEMTGNGELESAIITKNLNGDFVSKQEFEYTEKEAWPLVCSNYIAADPQGNEWTYVGHMKYEYDDLGRVTAAENVDETAIYSCVRYEYIYDTDLPLYNTQICYTMNYDMEWENYQMGTYEFDSNGNTIQECFYSWDFESEDWMPAYKKAAEYNEVGWQTFYANWLWDAQNGEWTGYDEWSDNVSYRWEYNQAGDVTVEYGYVWENGAWSNYQKKINEYNTSGLRTRFDWLYWNRAEQDWTGLDTWGKWASMKYNQYELFEYDEFGRMVAEDVFTQNDSGEYRNNYRFVNEYTELEEGGLETTKYSGNVLSDEYKPYNKVIERTNHFDEETFYGSYNLTNDNWVMNQEVETTFDDYGFYIGSESYVNNGGVRRKQSKELNTYADDFNPLLGYFTPACVEHWVATGAGEGEWKKKDQVDYLWGPRDVMISAISYDFLMSDGCRTQGFDMEFDFAASTAEIIYWPDVNKTTAFYENKTLSATGYVNFQYYNGVDEWDKEYSYIRTYIYTPRGETGVETTSAAVPNVVEVARYDATGASITSAQKGFNIIRYSDGTSRKVMVK